MDDEPRRLVLLYTPRALRALDEIWDWNAERYGVSRAQSYVSFLRNEARKIGQEPEMGRPVEEFPSVRQFIVRRRAKTAGHIIVYRVRAGAVEVLGIYHTAQDWRRTLEPPES